jgi:hypothetical protein
MYRSFSGNSFQSQQKKKDLMAGFSKTQLPPTLHMSMHALPDVFEGWIISSGIWPVHSPNLNPCDIFFWGFLKNRVYNSNPLTEELKENICSKIANIPAEQLQRVNQNYFYWCEECLYVEGQYFQHFLWSVNCKYFNPTVIGKQTYRFIGKIHYEPHSWRCSGHGKAQSREPVNKGKNLPVLIQSDFCKLFKLLFGWSVYLTWWWPFTVKTCITRNKTQKGSFIYKSVWLFILWPKVNTNRMQTYKIIKM